MKNALLVAALLLTSPLSVLAQDIPLSKILVEKEGWKEVPLPKDLPDPKSVSTSLGRYDIIPGLINEDFKRVGFVTGKGDVTAALQLKSHAVPTCLTLWPDGGHVVIGLADGPDLWAVRIEKDGKFGPGDRYYSLRIDPNRKLHVSAMIMDAAGLLYACTPLGVQIFDPTGRLCGVVPVPTMEPLTRIAIGGEGGNQLIVECGNQAFARKIQGKAVPRAEK